MRPRRRWKPPRRSCARPPTRSATRRCKADKAGIVTAVTGEPGQVVSAGQAVVTLADAGETEIAVAVPEQDAGRLSDRPAGQGHALGGSARQRRGRIREIAGQADPASRTYAVRIAVDAPPQAMRLGMTATVALAIDDEAAPMVVPLTALTEERRRPSGVRRRPERTRSCARRPSRVGGIAEDGVRIASGLQAGDMVVTAGVQFLRDGMRVRLPGERAHAGDAQRPD